MQYSLYITLFTVQFIISQVPAIIMATIDFEEVPESVEEAGALLGATITLYDIGSYTIINPPKGTFPLT